MRAHGSLLYCGDLPNLQTPVSKMETLTCLWSHCWKPTGHLSCFCTGNNNRSPHCLHLFIMCSLTYVFLWEICLRCEVSEDVAFIFRFSAFGVWHYTILIFDVESGPYGRPSTSESLQVMAGLSLPASPQNLWFTKATVAGLLLLKSDLSIFCSGQATGGSLYHKPGLSF